MLAAAVLVRMAWEVCTSGTLLMLIIELLVLNEIFIGFWSNICCNLDDVFVQESAVVQKYGC